MSGVLPTDQEQNYRADRLEALRGLILIFSLEVAEATWEAILQLPFLHLTEGSGQALQYHPDAYSVPRLQP
jgi:hypothetical protein